MNDHTEVALPWVLSASNHPFFPPILPKKNGQLILLLPYNNTNAHTAYKATRTTSSSAMQHTVTAKRHSQNDFQ